MNANLAAIPALLLAINEFLKKMGLNEKWCPLVNLIGGFGALPFLLQDNDVYSSILMCLMIGLSAGGFYDLGQKTIRGK